MLEHYIKTADSACEGLLSPSQGFFTHVALCLPLPQVYIAAFAVSAYSSTYHRAGCKPFNPVLGETYECERPDRGFRFISEQVWPLRWEDCFQGWARGRPGLWGPEGGSVKPVLGEEQEAVALPPPHANGGKLCFSGRQSEAEVMRY